MKSSKLMVKILKALANEKRLKIFKLLLDGPEYDVSEIAEELRMPFQTVSRHLEKLRSTDLVGYQQQGLRNYYSISDFDESLIRDLIGIIRKYF